jgi:uncharacterized RDD family membrane protein YckC
MTTETKIRLVEGGIKVLTVAMVTVWLALIYQFAISGLPMIRQLLGCMFTTMVIFGLLSFVVGRLKTYKETLEASG